MTTQNRSALPANLSHLRGEIYKAAMAEADASPHPPGSASWWVILNEAEEAGRVMAMQPKPVQHRPHLGPLPVQEEWAGWHWENDDGRIAYSSIHLIVDEEPACPTYKRVQSLWNQEEDSTKGKCGHCQRIADKAA